MTEAFGQSRSDTTRSAARDDGFAVEDSLDAALERAAEIDALVVLAAPVPAFAELLNAVDRICPTIRLTDVGSMKTVVDEQVRSHAPQARFIGSHPMCGTQFSGWAAGSATLFDGAVWVTSLTEDSQVEDWAAVARLALALGSKVVPADPRAHDEAVARISHLPHLLALSLAQVGQNGGALALSLAAGSFADGTRVASTRPDLIRAMTEMNTEALVDATDELLGLLGVARGSLASTGSLRTLTENGHRARIAYERRDDHLTDFVLSGDELLDELLSVGSAGGHVYGIDGDGPDLFVKVRYPDEV